MGFYEIGRRKKFSALAVVAILIAASATSVQAGAEQLAQQVEIRRTEYGVPHITAENYKALGFGFGYCQAEDHLHSIMRLIIAARSELAKNFGDSRANIDSDFRNLQFRTHARAVETFHRLDPDFRDVYEGFAEGLNYYIRLHRAELPEWIQPVTPHDLNAHGMAGVMRFAFNRGNIIRRFLQSTSAGENEAEDESSDSRGSNMWAFGPSRTKSGRAILMGNPHQGWAEVSTYYEAHLIVPGKLNFYGTTFVGRPVLTTGFNENLGWTHTVNYPDLEEIYELDLDPANKQQYLFDGGSVPIRAERHTIEIKTSEGTRTETREFEHTPLGPVIERTEDKIYVIKSAMADEFRFYEQWFKMNHANNFEEFRAVMDMRAVPMFNTGYADREGNIYYLWNGSVPKLPHESHRSEPVPATNSAQVWTDFHAIDELPQLFNPEGGYIQNCNDPPYFTSLRVPLDIDNYPPYFPRHRLLLRSQHSLALVDNDKKFSLEEVRDLKFSPRMLLAERVKDDLVAALKKSDPNDEMRKAIALLEEWDDSVRAESRGSVLFAAWWGRYSNRNENAYAVEWTPDDPVGTPRGIGDPAGAVEAFAWALEETAKNHGRWDVAWGDVHRVRIGDVDLPVSGGPGGLGCFRVLDFRNADDGKRVVRTGDSSIFAVEFGDQPRAYSVIGYSQSEYEDSPWFNDQTPLFANNQMKRVAFTDQEIRQQLVKRYRPGEEAPAK